MSRERLNLGRAFINLFYKRESMGYCAFCKGERSYPGKKHLYLHEICSLVIASFIFGAALWSPWDPRAIIIFVVLFGSGEIFTFLRWRMGLICKHCGFDPVLYNSSPSKAREKVRDFYESKVNTPSFQLTRSPLLEVHKARLEQERLKLKLQRVKSARMDQSNSSTTRDSLPPASS